METPAQIRRSSIVRIPTVQLERATRRLAWQSFRARIVRFVRAAVAERRIRRAFARLETKRS
jgi:hypothetical protein